MNQKLLNLLGLATKAGCLVSGEDIVLDAIRKKQAKIVFIANDSSENTFDKFNKKCFFYNIELNSLLNEEQISHSIGKTRKIIAVTDTGFYKLIKKAIGGVENEGKRNN